MAMFSAPQTIATDQAGSRGPFGLNSPRDPSKRLRIKPGTGPRAKIGSGSRFSDESVQARIDWLSSAIERREGEQAGRTGWNAKTHALVTKDFVSQRDELTAYLARPLEGAPATDDGGGGGGPTLGGTEPPEPLLDLQSAFDNARAAGIRNRKRAAAGSQRLLTNAPGAATPVFKRRVLLGGGY